MEEEGGRERNYEKKYTITKKERKKKMYRQKVRHFAPNLAFHERPSIFLSSRVASTRYKRRVCT